MNNIIVGFVIGYFIKETVNIIIYNYRLWKLRKKEREIRKEHFNIFDIDEYYKEEAIKSLDQIEFENIKTDKDGTNTKINR